MSKKANASNILRLLRLFVKDIPIGACTYVFPMCFIVTGAQFLFFCVSQFQSLFRVGAGFFYPFISSSIFHITAVLLLPQNYAVTRYIIEIEILSTHLC